MTFSNVVISTSVKIWSISGMSRAPLEAKEEKISLGQKSRGWQIGDSWCQHDYTKKHSADNTHLRKMLEWLRRLSSAESRSGHFLRSSTRKNSPWHSFLSSASLSFSI